MFHTIDIATILLGINFLAWAIMRRKRSRERTERRVVQLGQAAICLRQQAGALGKFLNDPDTPLDLKSVLIGFSDAMADEATASEIAAYMCDHWRDDRPPSQDGKALIEAVERLREIRPDLAAAFQTAVGAAMAAGFLRWPKAARSVDLLTARLVADPSQEVAAAAEGARLHTGLRFGLRPASAVMA